MWSTYHFEICLIGGLLILALYFWILKKAGILKAKNAIQIQEISSSFSHSHSLIDPIELLPFHKEQSLVRPVEQEREYEAENWDDIELIPVDEVSFLLREADYVVEQIQEVLAHIASNPPNPEEVTSKVSSIVQPYRIFFDTEYYDSINAYISLAVERDCGILLSKAEIESLWFKGSA